MVIMLHTDPNSIANRSDQKSRVAYLGNSATEMHLRLMNLLQTTLDLSQLLQLFHQAVQDVVPVGSLQYRSDIHNAQVNVGRDAAHSCHYRLLTERDYLGEMVFTRSKRFSERELETLESLITHLICPLRNALLYREAVRTALSDQLTGVGNRVALERHLEREVALNKRYHEPLSVLVLDVDFFKRINDTHGHTAGDCVLKDVARLITNACRQTDAVFRFGGEEFVVLLNRTDTEGAYVIAERIRQAIADATTTYGEHSIQATASIGIATMHEGETIHELFDRADRALYAAKDAGRNRVINGEQSASVTELERNAN